MLSPTRRSVAVVVGFTTALVLDVTLTVGAVVLVTVTGIDDGWTFFWTLEAPSMLTVAAGFGLRAGKETRPLGTGVLWAAAVAFLLQLDAWFAFLHAVGG